MLKPYVFYTSILSTLGLAGTIALIWVVNSLDPNASAVNIYAFYGAVGGAGMFISALVMFLLRQRFGIREMVSYHFWVSVRQGFWVAVMLIVSLVLQSNELFSWINAGFLIAALAFLESYFIYNERQKQRS